MSKELDKVNIRPGVTILSVLKHLNYKPYYALAEFIDNSIDSYLKNQDELLALNGNDYELNVNIDFDSENSRIIITDNASGIHKSDYSRAFRTAEIPPDNTKLSEFGMGMKSAACWFSNKWEVRTSALGEPIERTVNFDISQIIEDKLNELDISSRPVDPNSHYTVITLYGVHEKMPIRRGLGKVKHHLASIYRDFIRKDILNLTINGTESLTYKSPKILNAPYYEDPDGEKIRWKQEVEFDFGNDGKGGRLRASGFVAIMDKMSISDNGFALFRRGRVIEGSADKDDGFRPSKIMGSIGSHRYKRLFGELHLEGFKVSHTKDGFQWDDNMDVFLEFLKEELESESSIPILKQADRLRVRESSQNYIEVSKRVVDSTTRAIEPSLSSDIEKVREKQIEEDNSQKPLDKSTNSYFRTFTLHLNDNDWTVHLEVSFDDSISELFQVGDHIIPPSDKVKGVRNIGVRLSLIHPFMIEFAGDDRKIIEPLLRFAVALGLSEVIAKETKSAITEVRNNMNELLHGSLSRH